MMSQIARLFSIVVAFAALMTPALAAETLDDVEKKILDKWKERKSVKAEFTMEVEIFTGPYRTASTTTGTIEYLRKGDKNLFRQESHTSQSHDMEGEHMLDQQQDVTMVGDGDVVYTMSESEHGRSIVKSRQTPANVIIDSQAVLRKIRRVYNLKLLGSGEEHKNVYIIEATPKRVASPKQGTRVIRHFDKKTGLMTKRISFDKDDRPRSTLTIHHIKVDLDIAPERFKFVVPEGAIVKDNTE